MGKWMYTLKMGDVNLKPDGCQNGPKNPGRLCLYKKLQGICTSYNHCCRSLDKISVTTESVGMHGFPFRLKRIMGRY